MTGRLVVYVSFVVLAIALGGWGASYVAPRTPTVLHARADRVVFMTSRNGRVCVWTQSIAPPPPKDCSVRLSDPYRYRVSADGSLFAGSLAVDWPRAGEGWASAQRDFAGIVYVGRDPYSFTVRFRPHFVRWWWIAAAGAVAPGVAGARAIRRRRRELAGRCPRCGYDLRATPDRCPECGTTATISSPQSDRTPRESASAPPPTA